MTVLLRRVATMDQAVGSEENLVFAPQSVELSPRFVTRFPRREQGVLFGDDVLACFGMWTGIDPAHREELAGQVRPLWHRGPDDFAIELVAGELEMRVARIPALRTLGEASERLTRARAARGGWWRRLVGRDAFGTRDVLKIPELDAATADGTVALRLHGGELREPPEELTLGRGEMYRRYFVCDGPFVVWVGQGDVVQLVVWLPVPFAPTVD